MRSSIVPLSAVPPELVEQYLTKPGIGRGYSPAEARWKYFDQEFNQGRERGFAWLKEGRVQGFIGLIPVTVATPDAGDRELIWTCDWSVEDPQGSPGIGVLLLSKVHKSYDFVGGVGGTEFTRSILPRMRSRTIADATVVLRRPLRLKPFLEQAEKAAPFLPRVSGTALAGIPLPLRGTSPDAASPTFSEGVSERVATLFDQPASSVASVRYDARHLAWLARSPSMHFESCHLESGDGAAGALLWRRHYHPTRWRLALRSRRGQESSLAAVLASVLRHLRDRRGATLVSIAVSNDDKPMLKMLKREAFITGERHDMYITQLEGRGACEQGFSPMTYLDTDLGMVPWAEELT